MATTSETTLGVMISISVDFGFSHEFFLRSSFHNAVGGELSSCVVAGSATQTANVSRAFRVAESSEKAERGQGKAERGQGGKAERGQVSISSSWRGGGATLG